MTVRRSVVGTRLDLQQSLEFARAGKVKAMVAKDKLYTSMTSSRGYTPYELDFDPVAAARGFFFSLRKK